MITKHVLQVLVYLMQSSCYLSSCTCFFTHICLYPSEYRMAHEISRVICKTRPVTPQRGTSVWTPRLCEDHTGQSCGHLLTLCFSFGQRGWPLLALCRRLWEGLGSGLSSFHVWNMHSYSMFRFCTWKYLFESYIRMQPLLVNGLAWLNFLLPCALVMSVNFQIFALLKRSSTFELYLYINLPSLWNLNRMSYCNRIGDLTDIHSADSLWLKCLLALLHCICIMDMVLQIPCSA